MGTIQNGKYRSNYTGDQIDQHLATVAAGVAPTVHRSTTDTYGKATSQYFGHVKLSNAVDLDSGTGEGIAATPKAVKTAYDLAASAAAASAGVPYDDAPEMDSIPSPGESPKFARGDHVHPSDDSKAPNDHASTATTYGKGTDTKYGHVKLSNATNSNSGVNDGVAATPAAVKAALTSSGGMIAPTFSTAVDYYIGDYVIYDSGLYRFKAEHPAGAWNSNHVVSVDSTGQYVTAGKRSGTTLGLRATAEGFLTTASGEAAHAEGHNATASGWAAHAEGSGSAAFGDYSHAEGEYTVANHAAQHVFGAWNIVDPSTEDENERGNYVEIVGNGDIEQGVLTRSNARTLDWAGNETLAGKLTLGAAPTNAMDAATKQYVDAHAGGGGTLYRTVTLAAADWSSNQQTVTVQGVSATETAQLIQPVPAIASQSAYNAAGILATAQAANSLTFTAQETPSADLTVYVCITEVGV